MPAGNDRKGNLLYVLEALAECRECKPGIVTRAVLAALAKIPMLTPELIAEPSMAALVKRIGLTPQMLERGQRAARDTPTPEMVALERLGTLAKHTTLTPEMVVKTLLATPEKEVRKALALHRSQLGKKGADKRHVGDREKRAAILNIWATGKFRTKGLCAEQEYEALGMSHDTARKALRGAADPTPWPARVNTTRAKM